MNDLSLESKTLDKRSIEELSEYFTESLRRIDPTFYKRRVIKAGRLCGRYIQLSLISENGVQTK